MARTKARNPECPMVIVQPFQRSIEARLPSAPRTLPTPASPTERSVRLLLSLPHFIYAEIFALALADNLLKSARETPFFAYVSFTSLITQSKALRSVCRSWTQHLRSSLFAGLSARSGLYALIDVTELPRALHCFPMLNHCVLNLGDMMHIAKMEERLIELRSHAGVLGVVRAVLWDGYSFQHMHTVGYGSAREVRSRTRIMQEYLEYPLVVECLAKRSAGSNHFSDLEARERLSCELRALQYYHAHLLRNVLSYVSSATHLTIPAFIMPILLGEWPYSPAPNSKIQVKLDSIGREGENIREVLKGSQHVQFVGLPNPFILPRREDLGQEKHDRQRRMCVETYRLVTEESEFLTELSWPSRRLGLHGVLEPIEPDSKVNWWLGFLQSATSSGRLSNLCITVGSTKPSLPIGPPSLGLRPTNDYFTQPAHLHLCEEFPTRNLRGITRLELTLLTICPAFFKTMRENLSGVNGLWKITSAPQLCSHWVNTQPSLHDQLAEDLAIIEQIMHDARPSNSKLDIQISLSYVTARLPVGSSRTLELYPVKGEIIYKCCPVKRHGLPHEYPCCANFTIETFSSVIRELYEIRREHGFGLFNLLDELAGVDLKRIQTGIQSYTRR